MIVLYYAKVSFSFKRLSNTEAFSFFFRQILLLKTIGIGSTIRVYKCVNDIINK